MFINFVELKKSSELRANSNSNSKLELDSFEPSFKLHWQFQQWNLQCFAGRHTNTLIAILALIGAKYTVTNRTCFMHYTYKQTFRIARSKFENSEFGSMHGGGQYRYHARNYCLLLYRLYWSDRYSSIKHHCIVGTSAALPKREGLCTVHGCSTRQHI